ncbi:hypothetical protein ABR39_23260 [Enterobacter genomosp. O]|uniref:tail fiber assembly protein n=1 Tax=Enterobacter genomosp. O TaxID=2364150 RepID=UPI0006430462|nr:tail assembly chaperone [Enterobacter genomosp. O]KLP53524.1 hypothetical protein ABR39_23260 [Enterobacter genomosp. O]
MTIYYSATTNGFYPEFLKETYNERDTWPADALAISERWYNYLLCGQGEGKIIAPNSYGKPVLIEQPIDWVSKAEEMRQHLLSEAYTQVDDWKIELQLGTITNEEKASLGEWMAYIKKIKVMDFSAVSDEDSFNRIDWPVKPSSE